MKNLLRFTMAFQLVLCLAQPGYAETVRYRADLSGNQEVPAVKSQATGDLKLTVFENALSFELNVSGLMNPLAAYIQKGRPGENGSPIVGLFGGPAKVGEVNGILAEGAITEKNFLGELQGKKVGDLMKLIKAGLAYVNIITSTFPDGELRGRIE